mgnify:CR=1 FL=1
MRSLPLKGHVWEERLVQAAVAADGEAGAGESMGWIDRPPHQNGAQLQPEKGEEEVAVAAPNRVAHLRSRRACSGGWVGGWEEAARKRRGARGPKQRQHVPGLR